MDAWDYFACGELQKSAENHGYMMNPDVHMWIGCNCHAEYQMNTYSAYAYLPIVQVNI